MNINEINILVACEESQRVCAEFRKLGVNAYSCDLLKESGGHPEWHHQGDVIPLLDGHCTFDTNDGQTHYVEKWDAILAFPPCVFLTCTGNSWFNEEKYGEKARKRKADREEAIAFFMLFANSNCKRVLIENPVGVMSTRWKKPAQIINPWMFGDPFEKRTCLWLKGLKPLVPTKIVEPEPRQVFASGKTMPRWFAEAWKLPKEERYLLRSKTFPGVARALAEQITEQILEEEK